MKEEVTLVTNPILSLFGHKSDMTLSLILKVESPVNSASISFIVVVISTNYWAVMAWCLRRSIM